MKSTAHTTARLARGGFALLSVLFVLIALLVLCAPFLMTARNASRASVQQAERVQTRLALDSAVRHARASLGRSHPGVDSTPYFDDEAELQVESTLAPQFWNNHDPKGVMWDVDAYDVAGRIDIGSAPPQVFANVLGAVTRLSEALKAKAKDISVLSVRGFEAQGFVWVGPELVSYATIDDTKFSGLTRGLAAVLDQDGKWNGCGPSPPLELPINVTVIDQRAFAIPLWRIVQADSGLRSFDAIEQVRDAGPLALSGSLGAAFTAQLASHMSVYGGVRAGPVWARAVRITNPLRAGEDCVVRVSERRNFNPGTTVLISDGLHVEFGIVQGMEGPDGLRLMDTVKLDYTAYETTIAPLIRRPVNINIAPGEVLEALFFNLQLLGRSDRITRSEAQSLVALCLESRPFTGLEDFLRRVVLPAAGVELLPEDAPVKPAVLASATGNMIDVDDALALYANALNANDERLAYSTMPLSFVSRDVYAIDARAAVNAESGAQRAGGVREEVALIVPQDELLAVWARQEDFEENVRLCADAPFWATGPNATSRFDGFSVPPSRLFAHWGTWKDQPYVPGRTQVTADEVPNPQHVFASREDSAWCQLMPARVIENTFTQGRMLHFDNETRDLEGRYLPDEPLSYLPSDKKVQWTPASGGLALGISASFWIKPRVLGDGTFLDFGTGALDTDRIWLGIEGPDLVLRVLDGPGDHPDSALLERGEARFELLAGIGPGLEADTWSHIAIDVRGNRPDQISLVVDGRTLGVRTPGLTRLSASFPTDALVFSVESGEGFPDSGVVRIGNELIEYVRQSPTVFVARHETSGPRAGFGGRIARSPFGLAATNGADPGENLGKGSVNDNHAAGTPVELYGYSLPLASNVPFGEGLLPNDIGRFAVGVVTGVEVAGSQSPGEAIDIQGVFNPTIGLGMEGYNSQVTALILGPADPPPMTAATVMNAFETTGGYALVMQLGVLSFQGQPPGSIALTVNNSPVLGSEVVHYTGWAGNRLLIDRRAALPGEGNDLRPHAFVLTWNWTSSTGNLNTDIDRKIFVVPISINAGASAPFLPPQASQGSEFAQITELAAKELTEWVRYDRIEGTQLVRSDPLALENCREWVIGDPRGNLQPPIPPPPPPPAGGPDFKPPAPLPPPAPAAPALAQQSNNPSEWLPVLGVDEDVDAPVTRTARTALQFRGVLGTYSHAHQRNTKVHPVWRVAQGDVNNGQPGHGDFAFTVDASPSDPGFPLQVHRAYRPREYMQARWVPASDPTQPAVFAPVNNPVPTETGILLGATYVAANAALRAPVASGTSGVNVSPIETRLFSRLSLFPSGERPRDVTRVEIGRALDGSGVPSAVIDEFVFGTPLYGQGTQHAEAAFGAQMSLTSDFGTGTQSLRTMPKVIRTARGLVGDTKIFLDDLPQDAGLLRIGSEIVCYDTYDSSSGAMTIAAGGRGLLGSTEETHEIGETITWLESAVVSTLAGSVTAGSASLPLEDATDFPPQGTVLIGGELIHYTRVAGTQLEMPRGSTKPGAMDGNANGLFRGRFGSSPSAHDAGEPVILFPFRYWDRWADRADAPELAYFGLTLAQPNAFWRGVFFEADEPPGTKIEVLQRSNPLTPWDAEPSLDLGQDMSLVEEGLVEGKLRAIGEQRDGLEWRVYVRYAPNAFDFTLGLSHGWKRTPRLVQFAVEYLGPGLTLRRVDE